MKVTCNFDAAISLFRSIQEHKLLYMYFHAHMKINWNVAILTLTSPSDIHVPTKSELVLETKYSLVLLVTNLNNKSNVCKRRCLL